MNEPPENPPSGDPSPSPNQGPSDGLPPPGTKRWVGRRKAAVIQAVRDGRLTIDGACQRYGLTVEELLSWQRLIERGGTRALRSTRLQQYRPATRRARAGRPARRPKGS